MENGQADRRTGGQADRRTGGQADKRTSGQEDRRTGGQADRRTRGQAGRRNKKNTSKPRRGDIIIAKGEQRKMNTMGNNVNRPLDYLASCYFWFTLFFISAILFPLTFLIWFLTVLFDRRRFILHKMTCCWADLVLGINPYWKTRVEGKKKIDPKTTYVMVSNHQSGADILVLFRLYRHYKWVAKQSLFYWPFIGWNMWLNGYISIVRTRGRSKLMMMDKAANAVRDGNSVMLFPEGTRSRDGNIQPFKTGAFRLALDTKSPILPIAIKGTFFAINRNSLLIHKNDNIRLVVLDPIPYEEITQLDPKEIATKIHDLIKAELQLNW